jgi:hypothetical protein
MNRRNIGLWPVRPPEIFSAACHAAGYKPAGLTDCRSMFLSPAFSSRRHQLHGTRLRMTATRSFRYGQL